MAYKNFAALSLMMHNYSVLEISGRAHIHHRKDLD